jgi:hypothetical protein
VLGFGLLTYDTAITHFDERHLVWKAPNSFSKAAFLLNRYLTPAFIFVGFMGLSGFLGVKLDDDVSLLSKTMPHALTQCGSRAEPYLGWF